MNLTFKIDLLIEQGLANLDDFEELKKGITLIQFYDLFLLNKLGNLAFDISQDGIKYLSIALLRKRLIRSNYLLYSSNLIKFGKVKIL